MTKAAAIALLALTGPAFAAEPLKFKEVLRRAEGRVQNQNARVNLANANLKYLETQSKMKWELRPQLGIFSFSNPALLASSLGLGLLAGKSAAPSAWTWQAARFDALQAEVAQYQATIDAQAQAARLFYDLLAKQTILDQLHRIVEARQQQLQSRKVPLTAIAQTRMEYVALDLETQMAAASAAYESASIELAEFLEIEDQESGPFLRVSDVERDIARTIPSPAAEELIRLALSRRTDLQSMRDRLETLRHPTPSNPRFHMDGLSLGFNRVSDSGSNALGLGGNGYLLGGNTARTDFGFRMRLRDNGEDQALADVARAQLQVLETVMERLETSVKWEVRSLQSQATASAQQARLMKRKLDAAESLARRMEVREQNGLESMEALVEAQSEVARVRALYQEVQAEQSARTYHLFAVCGLGDETPAAWNTVPGR